MCEIINTYPTMTIFGSTRVKAKITDRMLLILAMSLRALKIRNARMMLTEANAQDMITTRASNISQDLLLALSFRSSSSCGGKTNFPSFSIKRSRLMNEIHMFGQCT